VASIGGPGKFNLPANAIVAKGNLFIADTSFSRVHIWKNISEALAGRDPDVVLGKGGPDASPSSLKMLFSGRQD
jgi:hypothetical protein